MNKEKLSALLGRPLTSVEDSNFNLYLKIAKQNLQDLLCIDLGIATEEREFDVRENYRTVFTDIFTDVTEVKLNGDVITDFSKRQWDRRKADWFNSIVLDSRAGACEGVLSMTADWGFDYCSAPDFQVLLANAFALIGKSQSGDNNIQRKRVEDFEITFKTGNGTDNDQFIANNQGTISKYSICGIGEIQHGDVKTRHGNISAHYWIGI